MRGIWWLRRLCDQGYTRVEGDGRRGRARASLTARIIETVHAIGTDSCECSLPGALRQSATEGHLLKATG